MTANKISAAASLPVGLPLNNGWVVHAPITRAPNSSGGVFSHSYEVRKGSETGFLKALDFSYAFEQTGQRIIDVLKDLTSAYTHEREILQICKDKRLSKVVVAVDHGDIQLPGTSGAEGLVFYLIFKMADGDIRGQVDKTKRFETLWNLRALKDVCLGLYQVHNQMVAHQDVKPSNVLIYKNEGFRISDFGCSSRQGSNVFHDAFNIAGDSSYSPPELLYGYTHPEFTVRRFGCDLYMLGNLAGFMFTGVNMTAGILARMDPQFHPGVPNVTYQQALPYIVEAFTRALEDLKPEIDAVVREEVITLVTQLCNPDISARGHPRGFGQYSQYSLERYVPHLDLLLKRTEIKIKYALNSDASRKTG